jgi:hypothetical protein
MSIRPRSSTFRRLTVVAAGTITLVLAGSAGADAGARCRDVSGRYTERLAPDGCASPVGLCIEARYTAGPLHGTFEGVATSFISTADSPTTGVSLFTTDTVADVSAWGRRGTLAIKNAGAFHTRGVGEIVDLQTVTGGTGDFVGATGALRASGTFDPVRGAGSSTIEGTICLP